MTTPYEARTSTGAHHDGEYEHLMQQLRDCNREGNLAAIEPIILQVLGRNRRMSSVDALCAALLENLGATGDAGYLFRHYAMPQARLWLVDRLSDADRL